MFVAFYSSSNILLISLLSTSLVLQSLQTMMNECTLRLEESRLQRMLSRSIREYIVYTYKKMTGFPSALPSCS